MAKKLPPCLLSPQELLSRKQELILKHRQMISDRFQQYAKYEKIFRLGQMTRTWRKNGINYAEIGDFILYYKKLSRQPDVDGKIYNLSVFSEREDSHLLCQEHWVVDREPIIANS